MFGKRISLERLLRSRRVSSGRLFVVMIILICLLLILSHRRTRSNYDEQFQHHSSIIYNISDPFVMTNLIDQFLDTSDSNDRDQLWSLLVQSWSKSFELYIQRTQIICSSSTSFQFIYNHLQDYTKTLLTNNIEVQRHLTGFGLFFDYDSKEIRNKNNHPSYDTHLSLCTYFDLLVLLMKVQLTLHELKIEYFIGRNTLTGSLRHHDMIPWDSIAELNLPLAKRDFFIANIETKFDMFAFRVNESYVPLEQMGLIYKVVTKNQQWPQIEVYFYDENAQQIFDPPLRDKTASRIGILQKTDVFPLQLRPFGPLLLYSLKNPQAMVPVRHLSICEISAWNHQFSEATDSSHQWRVPCEQLQPIYFFVQSKTSWRRGYCEETLKTKRRPYRVLSYFRYMCQENRTRA